MSTPTTYQQFVAQLAESSLLSAADVETVVSGLPKDRRPKDGEQLARELVRHNKLTVYQAQQVYAGKAKELVRGNYIILDKLGKGGMGVVYKAEHKRMHRLVALKVLSAQAMKSPDAVKRFHREVEAAAKLNHPHIVAAYDADEAGGTHFLVMEYVEGDDLANTVKKLGPLPIDKGVSYILQAARGLEFAHQRGVIHRDIKPANMLLDGEGNVKILDMGLARFESDAAAEAELTSTGQVMGTIDYMAPEQALSTKQADQRSDIYSLGMSLWFVLTGQACYGGDSLMARMLAHREQPIPSLSKACKDAPKQLEQVFAKMIAKNAKDRYQSMSEVVAALETCRPGSVELTEPQVKKDEDRLLGAVLRENAHPSQMKLPVAQPLPPVKTAPSIVTAKPPAARKEVGAAGSAPARAAAPPARSRTSIHAVDDTMNTGAPSGSTSSQLQQLFNVATPAPLPAGIAKKKPQPWWQDRRVLLFGGIGAAAVAAVLLLGIAGIAYLFTSPETETADGDSTTTTTGDNGAGIVPPVTPPSTSSSIVALDELGASPFHMAPWPSTDGLRLYYEGFTGKGTSGHGVLMASRSSVGEKFGEPVFMVDVRHPCLTDDELEMVCINHETPALLVATRRVSRHGTFAAPMVMFASNHDVILKHNVKSPFISGDSRVLLWQRDAGRGIEFGQLHRVSRDAKWGVPPTSVPLFNEAARGKAPTWPWLSADRQFAIWSHGGDRTAEIWTARRSTETGNFSDFRPLLVDGKPLVGRAPRWCEATGELFFSQPTGSDNWQLAVLKDYWPQGQPASASNALARFPAAPAGKPLRWLGYAVGGESTVAAVADHASYIEDHDWQRSDATLRSAARQKNVPVVLAFQGRKEFANIETPLFAAILANRDIVIGVSLISPYSNTGGLTTEQLSQFGRRLKQAFPDIAYIVSYIDTPAGMSEPLPEVPPEVDIIDVSSWFTLSPQEAQTKTDLFLPAWVKRAKGRPVVLRWMSVPTFTWKPGQGDLKTAPGTMRKVAEIATKYKLAGVNFDRFGKHHSDAWPDIQTDPAAVAEIRDVATTYGFMNTASRPPQGFTALFNGRDLSGWEVMQSSGNGGNDQSIHLRGSGGWNVVTGGVLRCSTGVPGWLKTSQQYENFVLQLEYRLPLSSSNSGIYIRTPDVGHLSNVGMEVQIHEGTTQTGEQTGAIHRAATGVGKQPHPGRAAGNPARADGLWNQLEISCQGDIVQTKLNGDSIVATSMATNAALRDRPRKGYIGLANWMGQAQGVEFRNIWIKQLAASPASTPPATTGAGWQPLFPGDDISAWKGKSGMWSLKSGDLTGTPSAPPSYSFLFSPKPYADFELQFQARLPGDQDNSGVQIRSEVLDTTAWAARGPQVEVGGTANWGGLYGEQLQIQGGWLVQASGSPAIKRDDFNDYHIRCVGKHVTIAVNGVTTVDEDVPTMADAGLIAFQVHRRNTADVTFRNIQIRDLSNSALPAQPEAVTGTAKFNGHQYKFFPEVLSWKEARAKCVALGGDLAVIDSAEENWFVAQHIEGAGGIEAWIGATDEAAEKVWVAPAGAPLTYFNWWMNQPNNKGAGEHFALMSNRVFGSSTMNWQWSDQPNVALEQAHKPGFVCEWSAPPAAIAEANGWRNLVEADFVNVNTNADTWKWVGGQLHCTGTPHGVLRTKERFTEFEFAFEWRHMKAAGNAGALVYVGDGDLAGLTPGKKVFGGIELQILDAAYLDDYKRQNPQDTADWFTTHGDVMAIGKTTMKPFAPVSPRGVRSLPKKHLCKPTGQWNEYKVRCFGGELRLSVNGEEVSGGSGISPATGYICLQAEGSPIEFRNLRVREAAATSGSGESDGWIDLFNGRDLAGWQEIGTQSGWAVDKGVLVAAGKAKSARQAGWLMSEREFANFELQLEFSIDERTDSGVAFRCDPGLTTGNSQAEIQIVDQADAEFFAPFDRQQNSGTGSLAGLAADRALPAVERDQWHAMKVVVKDRRVQATVDGVVTVDTDLDKHSRAQPSRAGVTRASGPIGLQRLVGGVRYRNIRIRDLGGSAAVEPVVPQGWVELFNGKDLDNWTKTDGSPAQWRVFDKYMEVHGGSIRTKAEFGPDFDLAVEFWLPKDLRHSGQGRANSGVYLIGRHEVQICDAFNNNVADPKQTCGAIYNLIAPEVDAIAPPETWQSFAIDYRAPRWLANGALAAEGHVAIFHNGKRIITDGKLTTAGNAGALFTTPGSRGPIVLQDHGNPVRFRNIRIREH